MSTPHQVEARRFLPQHHTQIVAILFDNLAFHPETALLQEIFEVELNILLFTCRGIYIQHLQQYSAQARRVNGMPDTLQTVRTHAVPLPALFLARQIKGHVDMFLNIAESLFFKKADARLVVGVSIDNDHTHPLLSHAPLNLLEQRRSYPPFLDARFYPEPYQITVFPRRFALLYRGAQSKAQNLAPAFGHQTQFRVRVVECSDLILIPGSIHARRIVRSKQLFPDMKNRGEIVDAHLADTQIFFLVFRFDRHGNLWNE